MSPIILDVVGEIDGVKINDDLFVEVHGPLSARSCWKLYINLTQNFPPDIFCSKMTLMFTLNDDWIKGPNSACPKFIVDGLKWLFCTGFVVVNK